MKDRAQQLILSYKSVNAFHSADSEFSKASWKEHYDL